MSRIRFMGTATLIVTAALVARPVAADVVHADDTIVQGGLCVSNTTTTACADGESFNAGGGNGSDTVDLKLGDTVNTIWAEDTSSSSSFPTRDWKIQFNDAADGGANYFAVEDAGDTGNFSVQVFRIDAGAPMGSLFVDSAGRVGLGTKTPAEALHVAASNPSIKLEDTDGPKSWTLIANTARLSIEDTTADTLPFGINSGAPDDSLLIDSSGDVGFGTATPLAGTGIHVVKTTGFVIPTFESLDGNAVQFRLRSDSPNNRRVVGITNGGVVKSQLRLDDGAVILQGQTDANRFALFNASGLVIEGATCQTSAGGMACDAVFDADYDLESIEQHAASMWENRHLPAVGPTPEGKPISFNVHERYFGVLNELEKAHIYIEQLNENAKQQKAVLAEKDMQMAALTQRMLEKEQQTADLNQRMARLEAALIGAASDD